MARPPPPPPSAGRSADLSDLNKVWEVRALKRRPREAEARQLLLRIAAQVQPIMKRRGWQVPLLREFFPSNASLLGLNINGGREIRIRLRHARNDGVFLPYEDLLGTMLHELTHIVRGPHDARFYALLDELKEECEELMARGITGPLEDSAVAGFAGSNSKTPAFVGQGRRLGGFTRLPPPPQSEQRRAAAAAAAAERRQQTSRVMPRGPRKLGGDSGLMHALSPVQAAAMAAERRIRDDVWCGGATGAGSSGMNDGIEEDEEEVVVVGASSKPGSDVFQRDGEEQGLQSGQRHQKQQQQVQPQRQKQQEQPRKRPGDSTTLTEPFSGLRLAPPLRSNATASTAHEAMGAAVRHGALAPSAHAPLGHPSPSHEKTLDVGAGRRWECIACTLLNEAIASECQVCGVQCVTASSSDCPTAAAPGEAAAVARVGLHIGSHSSSRSSSRSRRDPSDAHKGIGGGAAWSCSRCTLDNAASARVCAACNAPCIGGGPVPSPPATDVVQLPASKQSRWGPGPTVDPQLVLGSAGNVVQGPSAESGVSEATRKGGACAPGEPARSSTPGASAREVKKPTLWTCRQCTLHNSVADSRCAACDSWRYSYGPPVAHGPLYRGT